MSNEIEINQNLLQVKEWNGQRVITLGDIDRVHGRKDGTSKKNFQNNRNYLIKDEDYFEITRKELREKFSPNSSEILRGNPNIKTFLLTETGYLMIVKSLTDDLAWKVQRELVNLYFKSKESQNGLQSMQNLQKYLSVAFTQLNNVEYLVEDQNQMITMVLDNMTLSTRQQQKIFKVAKDRINHLLGGAHSIKYKENSKMYFINLWNDLKDKYGCASYKDLNPKDYNEAVDFITEWAFA